MAPVRNDLNPALAGRRKACDSYFRYGLVWAIASQSAPHKALARSMRARDIGEGRSTPVVEEESDEASPIDTLPLYETSSVKIYNQEQWYTWHRSRGEQPLEDRPDAAEPSTAGDIFIHIYPGGVQLWVADSAAASTEPGLRWLPARPNHVHPLLSTHILSTHGKAIPSWVLRATASSRGYKSRVGAANQASQAENSSAEIGRGTEKKVTRTRRATISAPGDAKPSVVQKKS